MNTQDDRNTAPDDASGPEASGSPGATGGRAPDPARRRRRGRWLLWSVPLLLLLGAATVWEMEHSRLQSWLFSRLVADAGWAVEPGPSDRIRYPEEGPYDERLGYTRLPSTIAALDSAGFDVVEQARVTPRFADLVDRGLHPIYREKPQGGLRLLDRRGDTLWSSPHPGRVYSSFDSIPGLVWRSLVFIENRDFLDPERPYRNPSVEWDRLGRGVLDMGMRRLGSERNVPGGSTLSTQLEKFRHSPDGLTRQPTDKLRQMASASARAYLDGPETLEAQRRVVLDYLNSVPLAAQRGHGEVVGTSDGLWAWYGVAFDSANHLLRGEGLDAAEQSARARVYRQALSLLIAHRRPSYYLAQSVGRDELRELTDSHLRLLREAGVIDAELAESALNAEARPLDRAPSPPPFSFVERKAASQLRTHLMGLVGAPQLYELDRYDMTAVGTLDMTWQEGVAELFANLHDPTFVAREGFAADRMLDRGDPTKVLYSFTLLETTPLGNVVRVSMDNYEGPLSLTQAGRLELGSTAKLRTLVTYLEVVAELHGRLAGLPADSLRALPVAERDRLTGWAVQHLLQNPGTGLRPMLEAAMQRTYSASPGERFATGGGVQTFSNFDDTYDGRVMTVQEAFRQSVNLPSIRTMRDVVHYYMFRGPGSTARALEDPEVRQAYLSRFADQEGSRFLRQFWSRYDDSRGAEVFAALVRERSLGPTRTAWAFRAVAPGAPYERFVAFLNEHTPHSTLSDPAMQDLWDRTDPEPWDLNDLGYLARVHPLELWLARFLLENPEADLTTALEESADARQEVYRWLFQTRIRNAQDQRIRTMLELEAFEQIQASWRRLGYPFENIVPSYGTAIGSSGDRPLALAELVGILLNDGVRYPVQRLEEVRLAEDTPFATTLRRATVEGERVLPAEVAAVVREAMVDVVENGTARRAAGSITDASGEPLVIGGKTGTGDNRFRVFGSGGRLLESRAVNRTATLVFFVGDRHFGVITAYVPGEEADAFRFTSGLPSQILRALGPLLSPLDPAEGEGAADPAVPVVTAAGSTG